MAYVNAPFMRKVLHITKLKQKTNVQHECKSGDFRAYFKVAEWRIFIICGRYKYTLPASTEFKLTVPPQPLIRGFCHTKTRYSSRTLYRPQ